MPESLRGQCYRSASTEGELRRFSPSSAAKTAATSITHALSGASLKAFVEYATSARLAVRGSRQSQEVSFCTIVNCRFATLHGKSGDSGFTRVPQELDQPRSFPICRLMPEPTGGRESPYQRLITSSSLFLSPEKWVRGGLLHPRSYLLLVELVH